MDLVVAGQDDSLIDQLSFKLPSTSTYAVERRLVSAHLGSPPQSPGFRIARGGHAWTSQGCIRLDSTLTKVSSRPLKGLLVHPWAQKSLNIVAVVVATAAAPAVGRPWW